MKPLVPKAKMSKKERKQLAAQQRVTWAFSPVSRRVESKKTYNRKRISRVRGDGAGDFFAC